MKVLEAEAPGQARGALVCLAFIVLASMASAQEARVTSVLDLSEGRAFGGLSGIEVGPDGKQVTLITDRGRLFEGVISRQTGALAGFQLSGSKEILCSANTCEDRDGDAEGLAIGPDGRAFVSFEHRHRVARLDLQTGETVDLATHPDFAAFGKNSGFEALASAEDGDLIALPERSGDLARPFAIYRFSDGIWRKEGEVPRRPPFLLTGADVGPDRRLYLLERAVTPLGFRSRVRSFDMAAPELGERQHWQSVAGAYDNLEGISTWRDAAGQIRLTMVSDDNFLGPQKSQLVELTLAPGDQSQ